MKTTVYNPQKDRLETIDIEFNENNTTWFDQHNSTRDIRMITDLDGGRLISESDYPYPISIYDASRAVIGHDQKKARELRAGINKAGP